VILTFDLDFAEIAATPGSALPSVVIFRMNNARVHWPIERLAVALGNAATALSTGAIVIVDDSRIRIRELPIEG
jgi:predicted nuclease of predicted toxin-antitoxin system